MPSSIEDSWAWIVVARAYTIHPLGVGAAPAAPPDNHSASYSGLVLATGDGLLAVLPADARGGIGEARG
jgi:hypothetical protein